MRVPKYDLAAFQRLLREGKWTFFHTTRAQETKWELGWESDDEIYNILDQLEAVDFERTRPNCPVAEIEGVDFVDADQYSIYWHIDQGCRKHCMMSGVLRFSLKIAIEYDLRFDGQFDEEPSVDMAGLVTFHISDFQE